MARWDYGCLGAEEFPEALSALEIEHFFALEPAELAEVRQSRGPMDRLAGALQIGFIKMTGAPLNSVQLILATVLDHVGRQLPDPARPSTVSPSASRKVTSVKLV